MNRVVHDVHEVSRKPVLMGLVISICGSATATVCLSMLGFWPKEYSHPMLSVAVLAAFFLSWAVIVFGFFSVFDENVRLRSCAREIHELNHLYRDCLSEMFSTKAGTANISSQSILWKLLLVKEQEALNRACQIIAEVFRNLTDRKCMVAVKLLQEQDGRLYSFTWARSEMATTRDKGQYQKFRVGTGENTAFDEALQIRPNMPSHFLARDLLALQGRGLYNNQREAWEDCYRSVLVVPIRRVVDVDERHTDNLGFLCVDTMSTNRLNNTHDLQFLAAFADQMYNFISIMRGRYSLGASEIQREGAARNVVIVGSSIYDAAPIQASASTERVE